MRFRFIEQDSDGPALRGAADGNDPMEFITAHGGQELQTRIDAAEPLMDFVYRSLQESSDITTPGGRAKALEGRSHAHLSAARRLYDRYVLYPDCRSAGFGSGDGACELGSRVSRCRQAREDAETTS